MSKKILSILAVVILIVSLVGGYSFLNQGGKFAPVQNQQSSNDKESDKDPVQDEATESQEQTPSDDPAGGNAPQASPGAPSSGSAQDKLFQPLSDAKARVTKKPFGIRVSPESSPVQPERFRGYHSGVDFEILPGEENKDVPVYAISDGTVIYKNNVNGYGGVLMEKSRIEGQEVTVLYGHLNLASTAKKSGDSLKAGEMIGILGKGGSPETDGERKHLHLGIHKGTERELRGYVQDQAELNGWLDAMKYL